jgi:hypothetical protein
MIITENYLDPDVAYLLGLITIRGTFYETQGDKRIVIEFPFKSLVSGLKTKVDQKEQLDIAAGRIRDRLSELIEADISVARTDNAIKFSVRFLRNSMVWRNLRYLTAGKVSYTEFEVPRSLKESPNETIKIEFLRGVADAGGFIRDSNRYMNGKRRVYIEVNNQNWVLPIQLCAILQHDLNVPVQNLQWGHPNVRQPNVTDPKNTSWAKEHQIKIFAEAFGKIGFYVPYKQKILEEFIAEDKKLGGVIPPKCNPNPKVRRVKKKPKHPGERDKHLPVNLRGKHFNTYWQICLAMGCQQCIEIIDPQQSLLDEAAEVDADAE